MLLVDLALPALHSGAKRFERLAIHAHTGFAQPVWLALCIGHVAPDCAAVMSVEATRSRGKSATMGVETVLVSSEQAPRKLPL